MRVPFLRGEVMFLKLDFSTPETPNSRLKFYLQYCNTHTFHFPKTVVYRNCLQFAVDYNLLLTDDNQLTIC